MNAVLRVDSIGKSFGHRAVLRAASMDAPAGTVTALLGRNGAGKSTLLKIAAGWLSPDHGFVEVGGQRYLRPRLGTLTRAGVFYLPVDRSILSPAFTLDQHLDALEKCFGRGDRASVLERLEIAALAGHPTAALSGGERRRAELSIAPLRRPLCLLASVSEAAKHWQFRRDYLGASAQPRMNGDEGPAMRSEHSDGGARRPLAPDP